MMKDWKMWTKKGLKKYAKSYSGENVKNGDY